MTTNKETARDVALELLKINAIRLNPEDPFTWASGWRSPIYCDNRLSLSYPELRSVIKKKLVDLINKEYPDVQVIAGVATAGIPQGALVADELEVPMIYVRSEPKGHGLTNQIEGKVDPGQRVVVVEDLISTGGSSLKAVTALKEAGFEVLGMVAIFTYGFIQSEERFMKEQVSCYCLSDYSSMLEVALDSNYISSRQLEILKRWRTDPANWS
ncbi:orotate phosphoribosyltransferase [Bacteroidota bacterium]